VKNKIIVVSLIGSSLVSCASTKEIGGVEYDTYGFLNEDEVKNPNIAYKPVVGNAIWGFVLSETIVAPLYFFGYSLYEPVGIKPSVKGQVPRP
jgi:hypothetical protein